MQVVRSIGHWGHSSRVVRSLAVVPLGFAGVVVLADFLLLPLAIGVH